MRVAFATCSAFGEGAPDDQPVAELVGGAFETWDDPDVDWASYDRVVLRSVWDYTDRPDAFLAWCRSVGGDRLRNSPEIVAFNIDKRYLADLAMPTVPTIFVEPGAPLPALDGEVVVKPNISAGARHTGRFGPASHGLAADLIRTICDSGRTALVQPYLADVDVRGEISLIHFHGELSHVAVKRAILAPDEVAPVATDGIETGVAAAMLADDLIDPGQADEAEIELARQVLAEVTRRFAEPPLYARVDIVRDAGGRPVLLELELIEPDLFLSTSRGAHERLAAAIAVS
jgi:hypothetical protein